MSGETSTAPAVPGLEVEGAVPGAEDLDGPHQGPPFDGHLCPACYAHRVAYRYSHRAEIAHFACGSCCRVWSVDEYLALIGPAAIPQSASVTGRMTGPRQAAMPAPAPQGETTCP